MDIIAGVDDIALPAHTTRELLEMAYDYDWNNRRIVLNASSEEYILFNITVTAKVQVGVAKQILEGMKT